MLKISKIGRYYGANLKGIFFFKDQNCTAIIYLLDKNAKNFCSIGFKVPILVFVDLIFFWQRYIFYCDFVAKNKKTFIFNWLDCIVILTKNHICWFGGWAGKRLVNRHHQLKDLRHLRHLKHHQQPQIHGQVVDSVVFVNKRSYCITALNKTWEIGCFSNKRSIE